MIDLFHHPHRDFWLQILFILSQVGLAFWEAGRFAAQVMISHTFLAAIVALEILILCLFSRRPWATGLNMALERFIIFNPVLNLIRHKPFFYTNATGSWMDGHIPKGYFPWLWIGSIIVLVLLKFLIHNKQNICQKLKLRFGVGSRD